MPNPDAPESALSAENPASSPWWLMRCTYCQRIVKVRESALSHDALWSCPHCESVSYWKVGGGEQLAAKKQLFLPKSQQLLHSDEQPAAALADLPLAASADDSSWRAQGGTSKISERSSGAPTADLSLERKSRRRREEEHSQSRRAEKRKQELDFAASIEVSSESLIDAENKQGLDKKTLLIGLAALCFLALTATLASIFSGSKTQQTERTAVANYEDIATEISAEALAKPAPLEDKASGSKAANSQAENPSAPQSAMKRLELEAEQLLTRFFAAKSWQERQLLLGEPSEYHGAIQRYFESPQAPGKVKNLPQAKLVLVEGEQQLHYSLVDDKLQKIELYCAGSPGALKVFLVDSQLIGDYSWSALTELPAGSSELRMFAYVRPDSYYNYGFRQRNRWDCWELTHPRSEAPWFGYLAKEGELASQLAGHYESYVRTTTAKGRKVDHGLLIEMTLRLVEDSSKHRQVEITSFSL